MKWEATDQFGNLYVGTSSSSDVSTLEPEIDDLLSKLRERCGEAFTVTVDGEYGEINGPDPDQVAYVLQVGWLNSESAASVAATVSERVSVAGLGSVSVNQ
ncbi:MAG TPA: hypothetical protein PKA27_04695 [Fimbriimonadaceae bacterium]|nr:hypothetical protein [Fimbriimonadaceae bacterium]